MTNIPNPSLDRRSLLRNSGIMLSFGAVVAACGTGRSGSDDPGRLGVAAPVPTLPEAELNDGVLLRTAQSIEYTAIAVYDAAAGLDVLSGAEVALVERFVSDHQRHAAAIGALVAQAGAEEFTCPNPFIMDRAVTPVLGALGDSDDVHRDVLNIAYAFEALAGATYQALVGVLADKSLRSTSMLIGSEEHRHAAALAAAINPDPVGRRHCRHRRRGFPDPIRGPGHVRPAHRHRPGRRGPQRRGRAFHHAVADTGRQHVRLRLPQLLSRPI